MQDKMMRRAVAVVNPLASLCEMPRRHPEYLATVQMTMLPRAQDDLHNFVRFGITPHHSSADPTLSSATPQGANHTSNVYPRQPTAIIATVYRVPTSRNNLEAAITTSLKAFGIDQSSDKT